MRAVKLVLRSLCSYGLSPAKCRDRATAPSPPPKIRPETRNGIVCYTFPPFHFVQQMPATMIEERMPKAHSDPTPPFCVLSTYKLQGVQRRDTGGLRKWNEKTRGKDGRRQKHPPAHWDMPMEHNDQEKAEPTLGDNKNS